MPTAYLSPSLLQDLTNVSVSPGAGNTGYPLVWNNTSGRFELAVLGVAGGGTGTSDGSITGTGALTFAAGGTNQDINLQPSGTGIVNISRAIRVQGITIGLGGQTAVSGNLAVGAGALNSLNTTGGGNNAVGSNALSSNTTGGANNAVGTSSLYSNTTGLLNNAMGTSSLYSNTTGLLNNAMGAGALFSNTVGDTNNAVGVDALFSNTMGTQNNAVGFNALSRNTLGNYNSAVGANALRYSTTGIFNSAVGNDALVNNTTGDRNSAIGAGAGNTITAGSRNIAIGSFAQVDSPIGDDQINIGDVYFHNRFLYTEVATDPAAPSANRAVVFARDNGSGKTQLCVRFNTGAVQVLATEP